LLVDRVTAFDEVGEVVFRMCYLFFHRLGSFVGQVVHPVFFRLGSVPQNPADSRNEDEKSLKIPMIIILTGSRLEDELRRVLIDRPRRGSFSLSS
jgi:hypothetical protein